MHVGGGFLCLGVKFWELGFRVQCLGLERAWGFRFKCFALNSLCKESKIPLRRVLVQLTYGNYAEAAHILSCL